MANRRDNEKTPILTVTPPPSVDPNMPRTPYDPLPNLPVDGPYDDPRSASSQSLSYIQPSSSSPLDPANNNPSLRPRFIGAALQDEGFANRDSYASSSHTASPSYGSGGLMNDNDSSIYALNSRDTPTPISKDSSNFYSYRDDPREYASHQDVQMDSLDRNANPDSLSNNRYLEEKRAVYAPPNRKSRRKFIVLGVLAGLIIIIVVVVVAIYFAVVKKHSSSDSSSGDSAASPSSTSSTGSSNTAAVVTGGDGSKITTDGGSTFTYSNSFGGYWYFDENDPFNNGARAQSWTPALNETFNWGTDRIRGVNLGGWFTTEPFIAPALYEKYQNATPNAVDEWTLSQAMAADTTSGGGLKQLETHYATFITEEDFAQIAGAGLNFVRIPLPYWAIETRGDEPFLAKTAWTYFLKAIQWARKYGLRINLDFHALPGSQNGWNHSGKLGTINVLNGAMGLANAQRSLDYIRILAEFISQEEYKDVIPLFGITNEPAESTIGLENLQRYYLQSYNLVRTASGVGEGKGPYVSFHDGFLDRAQWAGFLPGADRIALDSHPYLCFDGQSSAPMSTYATTPCTAWAASFNSSMTAFGMTAAGEWSNAVTDCGKWVNGVGLGARYDGTYTGTWPVEGSCDTWTDWAAYTDDTKAAIKQFALASMDSLQNWFFWTWKVGNSSVTGTVESPAWSYQLGLQEGWMPTDPRVAAGVCGNTNPWQPPLQPSQTGGSGAGSIPVSVSSSLAWPPTIISNAGSATLLPTYTATGAVPTLPGPTFTKMSGKATATVDAGNGWANSQDTAGLMVPIATCSYLDPWIGPAAAAPSPLCSSSAKRVRREAMPEPMFTPPPY